MIKRFISHIFPLALLLGALLYAQPILSQGQADIARILGAIETPAPDVDHSGILGVLGAIGDSGDASADISSVVSAVAGNRSGSSSLAALDYVTASPSGALDFISAAYAGNSYYSNGAWGRENRGNTLSLYNGPMPQYDASDFYRPVWGRITSRFGFRETFGRMHKGVDLALNIGDTVRAALPGIVSRVGYERGGYGNYVVINHSDDAETRYAHLQAAIVVAGQKVDAGEPIALGGNTGNSTGPHLHFEVRFMGTAVDPLSAFDFSGRSMNMAGRTGITLEPHQLVTGFSAQKTSLEKKSTYVVREGDTVKSIAKRAGIPPLKLCQLNFITESTPLEPGRMLKLR